MIRNNLIALAFFVSGGAMVWALDRSIDRSELEELALITEITGEQLQLRLETCIAPRLSLINQLTYGWDSWESVDRNWQLVANSSFGILSGILALNLVDMSRTIRQVYPYEGNEQALGADLTQHPSANVNITLNEAQRTDRLQRTTTLELLQSGAGFAIYKQIRSNTGEALGFVNGVFRVDDLLSTCFSEQNLRDQFIYRIFEQDNRNIFSSTPIADDTAWRFSTRNEVDVAGQPWILELAPSTAQFRNINSVTENLWMAVGMLLVLLLAMAVRALLNNRDFLDDSQARYRLLVENQSDLITKLDPAGKLLYASPSFCRVVEKTETELLEVDFFDLIHASDRNAVRQALLTNTSQPGYPARAQRARMAIDGRWTEWSSSTVINIRQEVDCIVAVGRDITEQKAMEEQVAHSQKMRAVGEMAGGISHDFNNLLQVILANIELLLANNERNDKGLRLENVRSAVNSGIELTQRLSTLSRQDSMSTETVNLNQLLSESTSLIARSLPATIALEYSATAGPLEIKGNRSQLERVLFNLCFNARDAIQGDGSIQVMLHAMELDPELSNSHPELRQGHYALIQVRDNGSGIDETILPRIFEPFFTTKRKEQGSGLGLANCYSIVSQHGGIITVESTSSEGTCFDLYLPLLGAQEAPNKTEAGLEKQQAQPPAGNSQQASRKANTRLTSVAPDLQQGVRQQRILVADDNEDLLQTIRSFLELETYAVSTVDNGLKAVELVSQEDSGFDLIILDLVMPGISGQEAATRIRMYSADVPILFISGYIPERDMAAGMNRERLLRKPFTRQELLSAVAQALGSNSSKEAT